MRLLVTIEGFYVAIELAKPEVSCHDRMFLCHDRVGNGGEAFMSRHNILCHDRVWSMERFCVVTELVTIESFTTHDRARHAKTGKHNSVAPC